MARYDYGLRGPRDTVDPRMHDWSDWRAGERSDYPRDRPLRPGPMNRVTARYNVDYVRPSGERYPWNPNRFGGDAHRRIVSADEYQRPYITEGGTWTHHGTPRRPRYDYREYGPEYGGRYPDEL